MPELPPPHVVREAEKARADLQRQSRQLAPAPFALLELAMGSMVTQALYVVARLRVAAESRKVLRLAVRARPGADARVEVWEAQRNAELFEEAYGCRLEIELA